MTNEKNEAGKRLFRFMCHIVIIFVIIALLLVTLKRDQIIDQEQLYYGPDFNQICSRSMCDENNSSKPVEYEVWKQCYPPFLKKYSGFAIINCLLVMLIGGLGNVLNLVAIPYVFFKYKHKFEKRWNQTTLLMLHLAFCDLAYVVVGMPFILNIYNNEQITYSNTLCWLSSLVRHWIAYADFLTLGIIAFVRMRANFYLPEPTLNITMLLIQCCSTWVVSFIIITPIISEANWFGMDWGKFGPSPNIAMCNMYSCPTGLPYSISAAVTTVGFFLPCFIILTSYLIVLPIKMNRIQGVIDRCQLNEDERKKFADIRKINKSLWILFLAYVIFAGPIIVIEWLNVTDISEENLAILTIVGYNWYFWIYAINFIVYLASLEDFREMYGIFLKDCVQFMCSSTANEVDLTGPVVYTVTGKVNLGFEPHNGCKVTVKVPLMIVLIMRLTEKLM